MSVQQKILSVGDVVAGNLCYGDVRDNLSGQGKNVPITYRDASGDNVRLVLQTPKMRTPFGLDAYQPKEGGDPKYSISTGFQGMDSNDKVRVLHELIAAIDKRNVDEAFANQASWFGETSTKSRDIIEDRYTRIIKPPKDPKWDDKIQYKLPQKNGRFEVQVFDENRNEVSLDYLVPNSTVICLVELGPVWIADKKFGQTIKCLQVKVFRPQSINKYAFQDDPDEDPPAEYGGAAMIDDEADYQPMADDTLG